MALPALALVVIATWEMCATGRYGDDVPGDEAWRKAAAVVRAEFAPGDLLVFAPAWNDPVGRMHLGDLMSLDDAARMDAARYPRIWQLSIRGAGAAETAGLKPVWHTDVDGIAIARFEQTPVTVVSSVVGEFAKASVSGPTQKRTSVVLTEVGFTPRRCVQVVPQAGKSASVRFPRLKLGQILVGYVGLADIFTRRDVRDPGLLQIKIDGEPSAVIEAGVDDGWRRFTVPTVPGEHDVEFIATAVGPKARDRHLCFAAEARQ